MRFLTTCLLIIVVFFTACESQKKIPYNYIENVSDTARTDTLKTFEPTIQKYDQLFIQVYTNTTESIKIDPQWNLPSLSASTTAQTSNSFQGFRVDEDGNIDYPILGVLHVEGLTKKQLIELIKSKIVETGKLPDPKVIVRFLNYRITVLGEVGRAGTIDIPNERVTILEAIGLAGDIPLTGKKTTVRIIREANGVREFGTIDLTSKDLFESPYYYLMQNDIIYVEPRKSKLRLNDQSIVAQRISFALTIVTAAGILYNIFK